MTQQTPFTNARLQARISDQPALAIALLQQLFPPASVVVAGANRLSPVWLDWPGVGAERIVLIDAQNDRLQAIQRHLPHTRAWQTCEAVLDATDGTATFHMLSHANESGLLPAASLHALWPNVHTVQTMERNTSRLDSLLASHPGLSNGTAGWLVIDCLPALRVLQGALRHLQHCSVVAVRVLVNAAGQAGIPDVSLEAARALLEPAGLQHAFNLEETHPDIVTALFVRHTDAAERLQAEATRDGLLHRITELEGKIAALIEERSDLTHAWEADIQAKTQAITARDAEAQATAEAMKARDLALSQLQQKDAQIATLTHENTELAAAHDAAMNARDTAAAEQSAALDARDKTIAQLTLERDQARQQHSAQAARMQQLEAENADAHHRHQLMQDEMVKAEGQIELIKDLLLREQGL